MTSHIQHIVELINERSLTCTLQGDLILAVCHRSCHVAPIASSDGGEVLVVAGKPKWTSEEECHKAGGFVDCKFERVPEDELDAALRVALDELTMDRRLN